MTHLHDLLRALRHRWGSSLLVLILATVAVAAATVGPTYNSAARTSIVQDTFSAASGDEQGVDATESGPVTSILEALRANVLTNAQAGVGGAAIEQRLFGSPVEGINAVGTVHAPSRELSVSWRDGMCANLHMQSGQCPTKPSEIMISPSLATQNHWSVGTRAVVKPFGSVVVTGIYAIPDVTLPYWSVASTSFFPIEEAPEAGPRAPGTDVAFTVQQTINKAPVGLQGSDTVDLLLNVSAITSSDVDRLAAMAQALVNNDSFTNEQIVVLSGIPTVVQTVHASWNTLSTPILVITGELLVLAWLLLFLVVVDAVEARGAEVALARLRGYGRWRSVTVAVSEPVTVLLVALPVGALIGWAVARGLGHSLRPGTPMPLGAAGWVAAALATVGGAAAVLTAARRVLRRPVVEQWRRTSRGATRRGWIVDAVLLTAAAAGLVQLGVSGAFSTAGSQSGSHNSVVLLVPALIGVAVAVVSSRLLPLGCRAVFGFTRRYGGLASFLAVRHVARRPGGTRTVIVLVTAFTLATFATTSWSIAHDNRKRAADVATGAATVFNVQSTTAAHLISVVDQVDPSGRQATAVIAYYGGSASLLAVEPQRFARIAAWSEAAAPQHNGLAEISPLAPAPIMLSGDAVRLRLGPGHLNSAARLGIDFVVGDGDPPARIDLGPLKKTFSGVSRSGSLVGFGCPCPLADLDISPVSSAAALQGHVQIDGIDVRNNGVWKPVPAVLEANHWRPANNGGSDTGGGTSLDWTFSTPATNDTLLFVDDRPDPLPVIVSRPLVTAGGPIQPFGLDGTPLDIRNVQTVPAVPGEPATGVVADITYAERAALSGDAAANQQVWVAPGAAATIAKQLTARGIHIVSTEKASTADSLLSRQGPGLAASLFLLDAASAALLAALGAIVSLAVSARRRRYEYAALAAGGVSQRVLRRSLAIEQLLVLLMGAVVGVVTGIVATIVSVRGVPEFVTRPLAPPLSYRPSATVSGAVLVGAIVVLLVVALISSRVLLRAARPSLLREPPT